MQSTLHHLLAVWMQFVLDWGYFGVFLMMVFESTAVPIPAEIVIPPAAHWAAQGRFNLVAIVTAATAGSWVGSAASY
jgi:membrane protein DedA with SNARE-associated domain